MGVPEAYGKDGNDGGAGEKVGETKGRIRGRCRGFGSKHFVCGDDRVYDVGLGKDDQADKTQHYKTVLHREPEQVGLSADEITCRRGDCNRLR